MWGETQNAEDSAQRRVTIEERWEATANAKARAGVGRVFL